MAFQPMPLSRRPAPFDHPEWIFELKYDGFRSPCCHPEGAHTVNLPQWKSLQLFRGSSQGNDSAVCWENRARWRIVCLDKRGRPQFRNLLFHRGEPCFFAFDLLMADGRDLRLEKLTDRKQELRRLLSKAPAPRMVYVDHVEENGTALFGRVCEEDL